MITAAVIDALLTIVGAMLSPLPIKSPLGLNTLAQSITSSSYWPHLGWANDYFPIDTAVSALTLIFGLVVTIVTIRIALWIKSLIWGNT